MPHPRQRWLTSSRVGDILVHPARGSLSFSENEIPKNSTSSGRWPTFLAVCQNPLKVRCPIWTPRGPGVATFPSVGFPQLVSGLSASLPRIGSWPLSSPISVKPTSWRGGGKGGWPPFRIGGCVCLSGTPSSAVDEEGFQAVCVFGCSCHLGYFFAAQCTGGLIISQGCGFQIASRDSLPPST